ncbi:hypothetical protein L6R49_19445 [Myxococcota bacterium]|nr:hypothetical protein [Myxococcota bacterium]
MSDPSPPKLPIGEQTHREAKVTYTRRAESDAAVSVDDTPLPRAMVIAPSATLSVGERAVAARALGLSDSALDRLVATGAPLVLATAPSVEAAEALKAEWSGRVSGVVVRDTQALRPPWTVPALVGLFGGGFVLGGLGLVSFIFLGLIALVIMGLGMLMMLGGVGALITASAQGGQEERRLRAGLAARGQGRPADRDPRTKALAERVRANLTRISADPELPDLARSDLQAALAGVLDELDELLLAGGDTAAAEAKLAEVESALRELGGATSGGASAKGSATDRLRSASSALKGSVDLQPRRSAAEEEVERRLQAARAKRGDKA